MKTTEEVTEINFETFVRVFALLLEENMNKVNVEEAPAPSPHKKVEADINFVKKLNP
jgi:hypothetical protein